MNEVDQSNMHVVQPFKPCILKIAPFCSRHVFTRTLTWIREGDNTGISKIAVEVITAIGLVERVHNIRSMGPHGGGLVTGPTRLNGPAIGSIAADVVYVSLECCIGCIRLGYAPLLALGLWLVLGLFWCWCWQCGCWIRFRLYHNKNYPISNDLLN